MTMNLLPAELFCATCRAYVHPFLDDCPGCGASRTSRYFDALGDGPDAPSLTDDPGFVKRSAEALTKLMFSGVRFGFLGAMGSEGGGTFNGPIPSRKSAPELSEIANGVASPLTYRAAGFGGTTVDVRLRVRAASLEFLDRDGKELAAIDPAQVVAVVPLVLRPRAASVAPAPFGTSESIVVNELDGGCLAVVWSALDGRRQVTLGNRTGFFASHGRPDHYLDLTWWLGLLSGTSAQSRWRTSGASTYAAQLGLRHAVADLEASGSSGGNHPRTPSPLRRLARSVKERLDELESLHAAGLVTGPEYDDKRRGILSDL